MSKRRAVRPGPIFTAVWEYRVRSGQEPAFEALYGPEGDWVRLFRRAEGFLGTTLLRTAAEPGRYLTIDRWDSEAAYRAFRATNREAYAELDQRGDLLTEFERVVGEFETVPG
jgi:heme-degrading monooxygenase HmoA